MDLHPAIIRGIERSEPAALEALARHYAAPVYRYLVRLCGDATLAEDLAQDVAVQLCRALPGRRFPNQRALTAWVFTVATNAYRMHARRRSNGEVPLDAGLDLATDSEADPAAGMQRAEFGARVRHALECLPEPERRAVLLKTYSEMRYGEIAAATGEPIGTVKWRIARAYARLRTLLGPELDQPAPGNELSSRRTAPAPQRETNDEPMRKTAAVPG